MLRSLAHPRASARSQHLPLPASTNRRSSVHHLYPSSPSYGAPVWILMVPVCFFCIGIGFCAWWIWSHPSSISPPVQQPDSVAADGTTDQYTRALKRLDGDLWLHHPGLFIAGVPRFTRLFTRDLLLTAMLTHDDTLLTVAVDAIQLTQGVANDPISGREIGKIAHELPGVELDRGFRTDYAASDTTALYVISIIRQWRTTGDRQWLDTKRASIIAALQYILRHINDDDAIWWEHPKFAGATGFALKVTYWKDSVAWDRLGGQPIYPVAYSLTQAMYFAAVRGVSQLPYGDELLPSVDLVSLSNRMLSSLMTRFWRDAPDGTAQFVIGIDQRGDLPGKSSDSLHLLWFLEVGDISDEMLIQLEHGASSLISPLGYRSLDTGSPSLPSPRNDWYHGTRAVWPFEQAIIHQAAVKFGMVGVTQISMQMGNALGALAVAAPTRYDVYPELITFGGRSDVFALINRPATNPPHVRIINAPPLPDVKQQGSTKTKPAEYALSFLPNDVDTWKTVGDNPQLWTMAATHYFGRLPPAVPLATPTTHATLPPHHDNIEQLPPEPVAPSPQQPIPEPPVVVPTPKVAPPEPCKVPTGARLLDEPLYCPSNASPDVWACGSGEKIPWTSINDDYCDCIDGSDEPGTSACSLIQNNFGFWCGLAQTQHVQSSKVNDGICDCCDGADETTSAIAGRCPHRC